MSGTFPQKIERKDGVVQTYHTVIPASTPAVAPAAPVHATSTPILDVPVTPVDVLYQQFTSRGRGTPDVPALREGFDRWLKFASVGKPLSEEGLLNRVIRYANTEEGKQRIATLLGNSKTPRGVREELNKIEAMKVYFREELEAEKESEWGSAGVRDSVVDERSFVDKQVTVGEGSHIHSGARVLGVSHISASVVESDANVSESDVTGSVVRAGSTVWNTRVLNSTIAGEVWSFGDSGATGVVSNAIVDSGVDCRGEFRVENVHLERGYYYDAHITAPEDAQTAVDDTGRVWTRYRGNHIVGFRKRRQWRYTWAEYNFEKNLWEAEQVALHGKYDNRPAACKNLTFENVKPCP